jgi:hypothetical protein
MPCYRCGTRQVDPDRGESPWRRGVRGDRQVLICPGCQASVDWTSELDRCAVCSSVHLVRRLGEVECRDCGSVGLGAEAGGSVDLGLIGVGTPADPRGPDPDQGASAGLVEEVELALSRVLGRPPSRIS